MKLIDLAREFGHQTILDAVEAEGWAVDSVVPGACRAKGCDFYMDVEPDARGYDCPDHPGAVDSVLVRLGVM